jgi:RNA polymerase sigma-70 factor, ECF subfamily
MQLSGFCGDRTLLMTDVVADVFRGGFFGHFVEKNTIENGMAQCEDMACMKRLADGDDAALAEIVKRWHGPLLGFFYRSTGSREDAEDMVQSVILKVYRAAPRYEPRARFSTFLFFIARRVLQNHRRFFRRKMLALIAAEKVPETLLADADDTRLREIEDFFQNALAGLPESQRTAILLLKQQGMSYGEIAETMKTTEARVKSLIYRARQKLKGDYERAHE